ncbi:MAG: TonB family protein [Candidatus Eremiobacteraeota bacterium]|nr:TonB family protein [Candidatus Eremiobacteraeota bacterium]MBV8282802.1 TonB family protein [Candidatus Eremiobacteraeota bacterium]
MAPTARAPESLTKFSKRERKSIVLLSLAFIVFSALLHVILGSLGTGIKLPQPPPLIQTPEPFTISFDPPSPSPRPEPTPTPAPSRHEPQRPSTARPNPHASAPPVRVTPPSAAPGGGRDPGLGPRVAPSIGPGDGDGTTPAPTEQPQPVFAPCRMIHKVVPDYPEELRNEGIQGTASVIVTIAPDGSVLAVRIGQSSGNAVLDSSALAAARASAYACPQAQGRPEADLYQVIYTFLVD